MKRIALLLFLIFAQPCDSLTEEYNFFQSDTVLFIGNSITFAGDYITYFEAFLRTQYPQKNITIINRGMPSETIAGTSEKTHQPPRPYLFDRLDPLLMEFQPEYVFVSYGMNDGIYQPFSQNIFRKFTEGVERLMQNFQQKEIDNYRFLTPPPFEPEFFSKLPDTISTYDYRYPAPGYNSTMEKYSQWLINSFPQKTLSIYDPLQNVRKQTKKEDCTFTLTTDGIHPNSTGHWLIADQIIRALDLSKSKSAIRVNFETGKFEEPIMNIKKMKSKYVFQFLLNQLQPFDPDWHPGALQNSGYDQRYNRMFLHAEGLDSGMYHILLAGDTVDVLSGDELSKGSYLNLLNSDALAERQLRILHLIRTKHKMQKELWVMKSNHYRFADMKDGRVLDEETMISHLEGLNHQIRELAKPDTHLVYLVKEFPE